MNETTKVKQVAWRKGLNLSKLEPGTTVMGVPLKAAIFKRPLERALLLCLENWRQWVTVIGLVERGLQLPVYYCLKCKQIEDGKHRIFAVRVTGGTKVNVRVWRDCYRFNRAKMQEFENKLISGELSL